SDRLVDLACIRPRRGRENLPCRRIDDIEPGGAVIQDAVNQRLVVHTRSLQAYARSHQGTSTTRPTTLPLRKSRIASFASVRGRGSLAAGGGPRARPRASCVRASRSACAPVSLPSTETLRLGNVAIGNVAEAPNGPTITSLPPRPRRLKPSVVVCTLPT